MKTSAKICQELTALILGIDEGDIPLSEAIIKMINTIDTHTADVRQACAAIVRQMPCSATGNIDRLDTVQAILSHTTDPTPEPTPDLENNIDRLGGE